MSSIFSDPWFRRGTTLLSGELIEYATDGTTPTQGTEIVGQVKVFQDVSPIGTGERHSNRLVYCVAVRYIGNDTTGEKLRRQLVSFATGKPLEQIGVSGQAIDAAAGAGGRTLKADVDTNGRDIGVVDEYLPDALQIRKNDIVWVTVKGPTSVAKETGSALVAGSLVKVANTAGSVTNAGTSSNAGTTTIATQISGGTANGDTSARINLRSDAI
jgi:hypothetical protein